MLRSFILLSLLIIPAAAPAQGGRAAFDEGVRLFGQGAMDRAERQFERAIAQQPGVGEYHLWLGRTIGAQTMTASVVRQPFLARRVKSEFEKAVQFDPNLIDARDGLIQFHLFAPGVMGGDPAKAREHQREIARRDAMRGHMAQAMISWRAGDTTATERALRAAIAAAPDSAGPLFQLGLRQAGWGRTKDAFATYTTLLTRHPDHVPGRVQYARLAASTGENLVTAEGYLRRLLAQSDWGSGMFVPSRASVHARLGDVLRRQGRVDAARAAYQTALSLDKDLGSAKEGLKALN